MIDSGTSGGITGAISGAGTGAKIGGLPGGIIGGILGGAGGLIGGMGIDRAAAARQNTINAYMAQLQALDMPRYEDLKRAYERYSKGEELSPQELSTLQDTDSEITKLTQDKAAKTAQLEALAAMKERSRGGLTLQDKADLLQAQREIDRQQSGAQKAIMSNMAARGQAGSGMELAARLSAGQSGAQQASQNALNVAAQSRAGAIQALKDSASLAGTMGREQLDFDAMKAKAADETRRSNLERLQSSMQYNVGAKNRAAEQNFNRANLVSDKNVDLSREEQDVNKDLLWEDYENQKNRLNEKYKLELQQKDKALAGAKGQAGGIMSGLNSIGSMVQGFQSPASGGSPTSSSGSSGTSPFAMSGESHDEYLKKLGMA